MECLLKHGEIPDEAFNPKELTKGIKVEMEHTDSEDIAKQIAKAHLVESPYYYIYLEEMEKKIHKLKEVI